MGAAAAPAVPDVDSAFEAALNDEAAVAPPAYDPPPRQAASPDPDAPHGRDEEGAPLAPFGIGANGRPRIKPAGPGRGKKKADAPRVTDTPAAAATAAAGAKTSGPDLSEDLAGLGLAIWMGGSALKGGKLPLVKVGVPDLRPYAYVWHENLGQGVAAWNNAAAHNATVRGWVQKLAGEGSWQWVIGVGLWSANFLAGCQELAAKDAAELRGRAAAENDRRMKEFLDEQIKAAEVHALVPNPAAA